MIISVNWLKKFTDIDLSLDELVALIGARLVEIEEVVDLNDKYKDVLVAKVVDCQPLEGSNHLNVTKLDDGGAAKNVERDERGLVQVVCGAPNIRAGLTAAWLPPGAIVPETYGKAEPFTLDARAIRSVTSNGMIASARELDLYDDHNGILELDDSVAPGTAFKELYELDDQLLDIENKSLTHRPDTFGIIGFAREVAAIQGKAFSTPDWLQNVAPIFSVDKQTDDANTPLSVAIDNPELSDRYQAAVLTGANGQASSPPWMQAYLARVGMRPISAVVDITNYMMMLSGQPLHAFDYDKLVKVGGKAEIHVRAGRKDETLKLLDGRTINLHPDDIVIAAGDTPVALAGAMGGAETEIDATTKTIVLESATFNLYNLRATQMRHGIFSEAITRFTKGQPAPLTAPVLSEAVRLLKEHASAKLAAPVAEAYPGRHAAGTIQLQAKQVNQTLGSNITIEAMATTLQNVEFEVTIDKNDNLQVTAPYWRADIHIPEDLIEEIGRLNGFDSITPTLPIRNFTAIRPHDFDLFRSAVRQLLVRSGANEVLTYSFVHGGLLTKAAQKVEDSYRITNSISPNLQYYRQSLTPNLLSLVHPNVKQGYDQFALFELNKVHPKPHGLNDEGVPKEADMVALTVTSKQEGSGAAYYQAKKYMDFLAEMLGLSIGYKPMTVDPGYPVTAPFEYRRSGLVTDKKTGDIIGIVGEYKKSVARAFKLPEHTAGFELGTEALMKAVAALSYQPISRYPGTERDICFKVGDDILYQDIVDAAEGVLADLTLETFLAPVDIYQAKGAPTKNITIRLGLTSHEKTLTSEEATKFEQAVIDAVQARTKAVVV